MKKIGNIMWMILFVVSVTYLIGTTLYDYQTATSEDLSKVISKAEQSSETKAGIAEYLKNNPSPSNSDLKEMNVYIEQITVRDIARKTTGDNTIQAEYKVDLEEKEKAEAEILNIIEWFSFDFVGANINILFLALGLGLVSVIFIFYRSSISR